MKKVAVNLYIICLLAVAVVACSGPENGNAPVGNDTVYTEKAILNIYGSDPQRALTMIDSSLLVGNIDEDRATLLRARVYCYSVDEWPLDTVNQMLEGLMESDFAQKDPDNRQAVLDLLVYASRRRGDNVAYLRWATEKADFCHQQGDETEALRTEAEIGAVLTSMGEVEKGLSKLDGVIAALDKQRHFNEMDACIIALKRKIYVLCDIDRYDEVIPLAKRIVEKINDYREHPDDYDDGSPRLLPNEEKRLDYCDFYTSQAYGFLMIAYGDLGTLDSSRYYLALYKKSEYSNTLVGKMMLSSAYLRLGQYGKVKPLYDEIEARMGADTLNSDYALILRGRAIMAEAAGNYYAANSYGKRYNNLKETLNKQLLESRAHEYAARYHLQEEEMKVESEKRKVESGRSMIIGLTIFALIAIGLIIQLLFLRHSIDRKNKVLAEQLAKAVKVTGDRPKGKGETEDAVSENLTPSTSEPVDPEMSDEELFDHLAEAIRNEKLFLDNNFGRDTLMARFHLNERQVGAAFSKGSPYASIADFSRELRLEYACQLLTECPDMSISEIAATCGYGSPVAFNRAFKAKYEITPSYYREEVTINR
jgi:AraC-like DNA-binding protein